MSLKFTIIFYLSLTFLSLVLPLQSKSQVVDAKEALEKADFLLQNSRYDEALSMLDQAISIEPGNAEIYFKKANTFIGMMQFKKAVLTLEEAVKVNPEFYQAYEMLGNLYFQFKNARNAVANYDAAFQHDTNPEHKLLYKLQILDILDKLDRHRFSESHIQDAKAIIGDNFDLQFYEVLYLNEVEKYEESEKLMKELIKDVPPTRGNEMYFFELGKALHMQGKYKEAEAVLVNANRGEYRLRMKQFTPEYYFNLASAYFKAYEYELSEKYLDIALTLNPSYREAFDLQKILAAVKSDKERVIEAHEAAVNVEKDPLAKAEKLQELAILYYQAESYLEAISATDEYLKTNERDVKMIFFKAVCEGKLDMFNESADLLFKIAKNPKLPQEVSATFHFALGIIYKKSGEYEKAEKALKDAYVGVFKDAATHEFGQVTKLKQQEELVKMNEATTSVKN